MNLPKRLIHVLVTAALLVSSQRWAVAKDQEKTNKEEVAAGCFVLRFHPNQANTQTYYVFNPDLGRDGLRELQRRNGFESEFGADEFPLKVEWVSFRQGFAVKEIASDAFSGIFFKRAHVVVAGDDSCPESAFSDSSIVCFEDLSLSVRAASRVYCRLKFGE